MFETSTETDKLDEALAKAQGKIKGAKKDRINPAFKSSYADLSAVVDACREALSEAAISFTQWPITSAVPGSVQLVTRLAHGGQWMRATLTVPVSKGDAQGIGSAITYAKRYALAAALGIAAEDDDDGNAASEGYQAPQQRQAPRQAQAQGNRPPQGNQRQAAAQEQRQPDRKDGPNLEAGLRQIDATKDAAELDKVRAVLRKLAWNDVEKKTLLGAAEAKLAGFAPAAGATCTRCGQKDSHKEGCPGPLQPGENDEPGTNG